VVTYPPDPSEEPVFTVGEPVTILWSGGDLKRPVMIDLIDVEANRAAASVTAETPNDGSIDWAFPSDLPCGRTYQFYIQDSQPKWAYGEPFTVACENAP
jgi:Ser-Thr-rich glycosyl-phosphatidyl-inositol-anchored membrane family